MVSINTSLYSALCLLLVLFSGCSMLNKSKLNSEPEISVGEQGQILNPIANPYLSQSIPIPEGAGPIFESALESLKNKDWKTAETQLSSMTVAFPQLSGPWVNLGIVYWQQNDINKAREAFNKAIEINGLNGDAYLQFALLLREQGQFTNAEALYLKALEVWPHNAQAHINLGILYDMYMGLFSEALEHYEMAQKLNSEPDKTLAGWILDTARRIPKTEPEKDSDAENATEAAPETIQEEASQE